MEMYYQNETLYVDIDFSLNYDEYDLLKEKIFRIVKDYDVDFIVVRNRGHQFINRYYLYQLKQEYNRNFNGRIFIK